MGIGGLLVVVLLMPQLLLAQVPEVELLYDDGSLLGEQKTVVVQLTGPGGTVPPDTQTVRTADRLHFLHRPAGAWTFTENASNILSQIQLYQSGTRIEPVETTLLGGVEAITAGRVSYPRNEIDWGQPLAFVHQADTSATFSLPEVYAPDYAALRRSYEQGRRLLEEGQPLEALDTLSVFYSAETPTYEFVADARATLDEAAEAVVAQEQKTLDRLRKGASTAPNDSMLQRITAFRIQLDSLQKSLGTDRTDQPKNGASLQAQIVDLDTSAATLYDNTYETYRKQTSRVFVESPYEQDKSEFFVEALVQLLLDSDSSFAASAGPPEGVSTALLDAPRHSDVRRTLQKEDWEREFRDVLTVVDKNIRWNDRLFEDRVLDSLRRSRTEPAQPYYEVLSALDAIAEEDTSTFQEQWVTARRTSTDLSFLNAMQHWRIAARGAPVTDTTSVAALVDNAERLRREERLEAARQQLDQASRIASDYPPLLYEQGRLHQAQGDTTAALEHFDRAQTADTTYVVPKVAALRLLLEQGKYETVLERADTMLSSAPYWLVYFPKARALGQLGRDEEAIRLLREECEQRNARSHALYVMLADLYAEQEAWTKAARAVQEAGSYEQRRTGFGSRLSSVREQIKAADEVSLDDEQNASGASGS